MRVRLISKAGFLLTWKNWLTSKILPPYYVTSLKYFDQIIVFLFWKYNYLRNVALQVIQTFLKISFVSKKVLFFQFRQWKNGFQIGQKFFLLSGRF